MTHEARITNGADETAAAAATVAQIMTPEIVAVGMDEPLHRIQRTLAEEGFHHLLVVEAGELRGVISDRDLLFALSPYLNTPSEKRRDEQTLRRKAHHIMSRRLVTVTPDTPIAQAAALLLTYRIGCLPVVAAAGAPATDEAPVWGPAPSWEPAPLALGIHLRLVTEDRTVEGIVTWRDIVAYYLNGGGAVAGEGVRA